MPIITRTAPGWRPQVPAAVALSLLVSVPFISGTLGAQSNRQHQQQDFQFEVLSIRPSKTLSVYSEAGQKAGNTEPSPNGFDARLSAWQMLMLAYSSPNSRDWISVELRNAPSWMGDSYDINGRVAEPDLKAWQHQSHRHELLQAAMRIALRDRFRLAIHEEPSKGEIFELRLRKGGPLLRVAVAHGDAISGERLPSGGVRVSSVVDGRQAWIYYGATMQDLADFLSIMAGGGRTPVRDRTGLPGHYDFSIQHVPPMPEEDHVYTYPLDHLGLQVTRAIEQRPRLVIDHIERPTAN